MMNLLRSISPHRKKNRKSLRKRRLRLESLESRKLLAATLGSGSTVGAASEFSSGELHTVERFQVTSITLRINGETTSFSPDSIVPVDHGDELEIVGMEYATGQELDGVLALEAYVSKLPESNAGSEIDYNDGRFGGGEEIAFGPGSYNSISGSWIVEEGWDRLTLSLLRYFGDSSQLENVSRLRLQVGQPDFVIDPAMIDSIMQTDFVTGETIKFAGLWSNGGLGRYHNYLEIDVSNLDTGLVDWVGVSIANADNGGVEDVVENHNANDLFDLDWVPQVAGEYEILIAVDPENLWNESDETNNRLKLQVTVNDPPSLQNIVFALDRSGKIATHNTETGETTLLGEAGAPLTDLALSQDRRLFGISLTSLYAVDIHSGAATLIGQTDRTDLNSLTLLDDGTLIAAGSNSNELFAVDRLTGALTSMGSSGYRAAGDLVSHDGQLLMSTSDAKLLTITIENGVVTNVETSLKIKNDVDGLASTDSGVIASRGNRLYEIDSKGKLKKITSLGPLDFSEIYGLASIQPNEEV